MSKDIDDLCYNATIFALIWGVGAQIDEKNRKAFDAFAQDIIIGEDVNAKYELGLEPQEFKKIPNRL